MVSSVMTGPCIVAPVFLGYRRFCALGAAYLTRITILVVTIAPNRFTIKSKCDKVAALDSDTVATSRPRTRATTLIATRPQAVRGVDASAGCVKFMCISPSAL